MNSFKIISLTHKLAPLELIGKLHLDENHQQDYLGGLKIRMDLKELMFLSTCNRVEFIVNTDREISTVFLSDLFYSVNSRLTENDLTQLIEKTITYEGDAALTHLFEVSASLDSLVVGEREIITQVRKAYEFCNLLGLTGDTIRLAIKQTIETAKQVYTDTDIAKNPVSIVSLAYRQLRSLGIKNNARIVFIGAGETNSNMAKYLKKHQYANFTVFNRTLANSEKLAKDLNGKARDLSRIEDFNEGFDVLITCTASQDAVVTEKIYQSLLAGETQKKVIIDLALPSDVDKAVIESNDIFYIDIESLKKQAADNLLKRESEIEACKTIIFQKVEEFKQLFQERKIELAFGEIPKQIKYIKETALNEVFAKEMNSLDPQGKEVLDKVLSYMEKKYNALAIKTAKKVFLEEDL
ncbi:MAG: Serine carboxypeptidase [Bacteroidetes bacterium]|jgi:glutamyl-tRNA reductase|nr:Serine carboxypeptidase [Bacteroidota bacterium]